LLDLSRAFKLHPTYIDYKDVINCFIIVKRKTIKYIFSTKIFNCYGTLYFKRKSFGSGRLPVYMY